MIMMQSRLTRVYVVKPLFIFKTSVYTRILEFTNNECSLLTPFNGLYHCEQ